MRRPSLHCFCFSSTVVLPSARKTSILQMNPGHIFSAALTDFWNLVFKGLRNRYNNNLPFTSVPLRLKNNHLTIAPIIQRLPSAVQRILGFLTITTAQKATIILKRTKPRRRIACSGVHLWAWTAEMPYFKRFLGIEKVHRNSIKITVDLWRRWRDLNSCAGELPTYRISSADPSATWVHLQIVIFKW